VRSWYEVLGVRGDATTEELRAAHRAMVLALHPDTRPDDVPAAEADAALRLVNDAWAVLGDPVRRASYDQELEETPFGADEQAWPLAHARVRGFPWWILVLAVLLVIFVFTAYAAPPVAPAPPK
jgi:curved DNA-binding protein CbpA